MKGKRLLTLVGSICLILALVTLLLPACAKEEVTAPEATPVAKVYEWRCQNIFGAEEPHYKIFDELLLPALESMTGGRIKITQYSGGALVPSPDIMESVGKGTLETAFTVSVYNAGIMPEARLEFSKPGGTNEWYQTMLFDKKSYPILSEIWEEHNIYNLPGSLGGWYSMISTKPVYGLADLKGMKIRATGLFPNVFEAFGASPTPMSLEDLYTGLTLGTIDAVTYAGPGEWLALKLCEPAKYITAPGLGGTDGAVRFIINLDLWNDLPEDLQACLNVWANMITVETRLSREFANDHALKILIDDYGCEVITWPDEDFAKWKETAWDIFDTEIAPKSAACEELIEIMKEVVNPELHPHLQVLGK